MQKQITLSILEEIYRQVERVATETKSDVANVMLDTISKAFAPYPAYPQREALKAEIAAYEALHCELIKQYFGQ